MRLARGEAQKVGRMRATKVMNGSHLKVCEAVEGRVYSSRAPRKYLILQTTYALYTLESLMGPERARMPIVRDAGEVSGDVTAAQDRVGGGSNPHRRTRVCHSAPLWNGHGVGVGRLD